MEERRREAARGATRDQTRSARTSDGMALTVFIAVANPAPMRHTPVTQTTHRPAAPPCPAVKYMCAELKSSEYLGTIMVGALLFFARMIVAAVLLAALALSAQANILPTGFATFFGGSACPTGSVFLALCAFLTEQPKLGANPERHGPSCRFGFRSHDCWPYSS